MQSNLNLLKCIKACCNMFKLWENRNRTKIQMNSKFSDICMIQGNDICFQFYDNIIDLCILYNLNCYIIRFIIQQCTNTMETCYLSLIIHDAYIRNK